MTQSAPETVNRLLQHLQSQLQLLQFHHPYLSEPVKTFFQNHRLDVTVEPDGLVWLIFTSQDGVVSRLLLDEYDSTVVQTRIGKMKSISGRQECGIILHQLLHADELLQLLIVTSSKLHGLIVVEPSMPHFIRIFVQTDLDIVMKIPWLFFCVDGLAPKKIEEVLKEKGLSYFYHWMVIKDGTRSSSRVKGESICSIVLAHLSDLYHQNRIIEDHLISATPTIPNPSIKRLLILDSWKDCPGSLHLQAIRNGFSKRGIEVGYISMPMLGSHSFPHCLDVCMKERLMSTLQQFKPDWVFSLQDHTHDFFTEEFYSQINMPWITYLSATYPNKPPYGKNEVLFVAEESLCELIKQWGAEYVDFIPLAADYLDESPVCPTEQNINISFLGSCAFPSNESFSQWKSRLLPYPGLFDKIEEYVESYCHNLSALALWQIQEQDFLSVLPLSLREHASQFIDAWIGGTRRLELVLALQKFGIKVYGSDWHKVAPKNFVEQCYAGTFRDYVREKELYRNSKINLNLHWQGNFVAPNMRYFNIPAVGGFQLTNEGPRFHDFFNHDTEIAVYKDIHSAVEMVECYLTNEKDRVEMSIQARCRVRNEHLYEHRVDEMVKKLNTFFG